MNVLLLSNSHLPMIGGKEIVQHHLARQLVAKGHDVRLGGPSGFWRHRNLDLGYPVQRPYTASFLPTELHWQLRTRWLLRNHRFDVIHAHVTHPAAYHAQKYLQERNDKTPLIVTPHGADIHKVPEVNFGKRLNPELEAKIRWLLEQKPMCTAISDAVQTSLLDAGATAEHIVMIPNGVDTERFEARSPLSAHEYLGIDADTHLFVSVGNYHPRKGHENLIEALGMLSDRKIHVAIVGRTAPECQAFVQERNLQDRITFTGALAFPVPGTDSGPDVLVAMLQQSRGYISASMGEGTEGLSLALLEAMAAHACPIATNVSGNRDVVVDGDNGYLVTPGAAQTIADAMRHVCDNLDEAARRGDAAAASIAHLSWSAVTDQYLSAYERAISESSSVHPATRRATTAPALKGQP